MDDNQAFEEDPKQSSKCCFTDFLPSTRPSLLSVVLIFVCGCLWMNNESLRTRRLAVEHRLQTLSKECRANEELLTQASTPFTSHAPSGKRNFAKNVLLIVRRIFAPQLGASHSFSLWCRKLLPLRNTRG